MEPLSLFGGVGDMDSPILFGQLSTASPRSPQPLKATASMIQSRYTVKQLYDLLNGFIPNPTLCEIPLIESNNSNKTILDCIDECLLCIIDEWDDLKITTKTSNDVLPLLSKKVPESNDALFKYYDDIIYDELFAMALKTQEMNFVIKKQKMIYIPENWKEEKVDDIVIKHKSQTMQKAKTFDHFDQFEYETTNPSSQSHTARSIATNVAENITSYVLRDSPKQRVSVQHLKMSRTATILSDEDKLSFDCFLYCISI